MANSSLKEQMLNIPMGMDAVRAGRSDPSLRFVRICHQFPTAAAIDIVKFFKEHSKQ